MQIRSGLLSQVWGYMAKSEWIDDSQDKGRYYLDENGRYVTGIHKISGRPSLPKRWEMDLKFQLRVDL